MISYRVYITFILLLTVSMSYAQVYKTQPLAEDIHAVQALVNNDWNSYPVIKQNTEDRINISFDKLTEESYARLRYRIIYCNADWTRNTELSEMDYLDGFDDNLIKEYANSVNTTVPYIHYSLTLPNEDVSPKLPGNYVVEVYDEDDTDQQVLLTVVFSLVDPLVTVKPSVSSTTDIDANSEHHQLSFDLNYKMNLRNVKEDIKVFVRQNDRLDNQRQNIRPNYIMPSKLRFTHNKGLIFEAGDEYERFEISSHRHNGRNVAHIEYQRPYYHMYIVPNRIQKNGSYRYDQDQNGRLIYRNTESGNADTEGDYFYTHITLHSSEKLPYDIFINGAFSYNQFSDTYKMKYDNENNEYGITLLLKQGIYNYQFLTKSGEVYTAKEISGNFYETENEYSVYVYYRPVGQKYDSLVGFASFQSRIK